MKTKCPACKCSLDVICDFYAILKAFRDEAEIHGRIDIMPTLEKLHDKVTLEKALCKDAKTSTLVDKCCQFGQGNKEDRLEIKCLIRGWFTRLRLLENSFAV